MIKNIVSLFFTEYDEEVKETFNKYESKINSTCISIPSKESLLNAFVMFPSRDHVIIDLFIEGSDAYPLSIRNIDDDLEEIQDTLNMEDDVKEINMKVTIMKNVDKNTLSIYSFDYFFRHLLHLSLEYLMDDFNELLINNDTINFETLDGTKETFYSQSLLFNARNEQSRKSDRNTLISKRNEVSNLLNYSKIKLTPNDFHLIKESSSNKINYFFEKLSGFFSLIFLSDISSIENTDELYIKINGYKLINESLPFHRFNQKMEEIYDIYEWVFHEGTISDKVGLARNILSLNYNSDDELHLLKANTFNSIKSGYSIYLKENVQQYIEVTNKMSEYLIDLTMKANDVIKNFGNSFKNNNFIVASFFFSVIVFNSLSARKFTGMFTDEVLGIAIVILIVSTGYLIVSIYITQEQVKKFKSDYMQLKNIYKGLLNPEDLDKIFDVSYLNTNIEYVKRKVIAFSLVWALEIVSFTIMLIIVNNSLKQLIKVLVSMINYF